MDPNEAIQPQRNLNPPPSPAPSPPGSSSADDRPDVDAEENLTLGQWFVRNGPVLAIVAALFIWLFIKFDYDGLWAIVKAGLGLGVVIFIHELGHFLVAKWCDVHVTTFSIGFGPAIPGCRFKWGETTYKLALFPLGGYVQMVGQVDGDESSDGSDDDPRSYRNKTVWQRMAIISAGVVMNAILAVICFIVVFQGPGKDRQAAVVAKVDTGAPAFVHGVRTGAVIEQIGNTEHPFFEDLMVRVMATDKGEELKFVSQRPGDAAPQVLEMEPRLHRSDKRPLLGIAPASRLQFAPRWLISFKAPVLPGSAADRATPPFEFEDVVIGVTDPDHPNDADKMALPPDPRKPSQRDFFQFVRRIRRLIDKPVTVRVVRGEQGYEKEFDIVVPPAYTKTLDMRMHMGEITAVRRTDSPAADAKVQPRKIDDNGKLLRFGDVILRVEVPEPDGKVTVFEDKTLDPTRLPFDLTQWAERYQAGKGFKKGEKLVKLKLRRHREPPGEQFDPNVEVLLEWNYDWRFDRAEPFDLFSPLAIPELGLAYLIKNTVADVDGENHLLQKSEAIKKVKLFYVDKDGGEQPDDWVTLKADDQWARVFWQFQRAGTLPKMMVAVERNGQMTELTLSAKEDKTWPAEDRGFVWDRDLRKQRADNTVDAIAMGFKDTWNNMTQIFQNLRGMVTGRISPENLGGPVTIAKVAFRIAGHDFWEFVFFIGLISVNLAVINFLPIPVLDGGHMVFLIYEKIRGRPASEGVRIGATYAGLALILSLMVYVLYLDFFVH